jgi:hypothetical protein
MARYAINNNLAGTKQAISTAYKTLIVAKAATATLTRALVYDFMVGTNGTPADNYMEFNLERQTADGTATAITPNPLDTTHRAAGTVAAANATAEGTIAALTSSLFYIGLNQRASYRWVAAPGSELVIPATNLFGIAFRAQSGAYTGTATAQAYFEE